MYIHDFVDLPSYDEVSLSKCWSQLKALKSFTLVTNKLDSVVLNNWIPPPNLNNLDLSHCYLEYLKFSVFKESMAQFTKSLTAIYLENCLIDYIPTDIYLPETLEILSFKENIMKEIVIPLPITRHERLRVLDLSPIMYISFYAASASESESELHHGSGLTSNLEELLISCKKDRQLLQKIEKAFRRKVIKVRRDTIHLGTLEPATVPTLPPSYKPLTPSSSSIFQRLSSYWSSP